MDLVEQGSSGYQCLMICGTTIGGRSVSPHNLERIFVFRGMERVEVPEAFAGDIVAVTGPEGVFIGDTIASPESREPLPTIDINEPMVRMTFGVNTFPFMGREGVHCTSRNLHERLIRELRTNVSLRLDTTPNPDVFVVAGRGELHLSILVEIMRREQFEFQVSRPTPVTKVIGGKIYEPYEILSVSTQVEHVGVLTEHLSARMAQLLNVRYGENGYVHMEYKIPTRGMIGFDAFFLRTTHGDGLKEQHPHFVRAHGRQNKGPARRSTRGVRGRHGGHLRAAQRPRPWGHIHRAGRYGL